MEGFFSQVTHAIKILLKMDSCLDYGQKLAFHRLNGSKCGIAHSLKPSGCHEVVISKSCGR